MRGRLLFVIFFGIAIAVTNAHAGLPLETETARPPGPGILQAACGYEHQVSASGSEAALPIAFELGVGHRLELLAEPVPYTFIGEKHSPKVRGVGDLELTGLYLLVEEQGARPAVAFAAEAKLPTAKNRLIGSGKADGTFYLIGSKRLGRFEAHGNLDYAVIGRPPYASVQNVLGGALALEYHYRPRVDLVGEIYGSTAALRETADEPLSGSESTITPEIGGGEFVGMLGARYAISPGVGCSLGVSYDNNGAVLVQPGITVSLR